MKRAVIVLAGTGVGLAGVLSFHTSAAKLPVGIVSSPTTLPVGSTSTTAASTNAASSSAPSTPTTASTQATASAPTAAPATTTTTAAPAGSVRTATGAVVNYYFGTISISVSVQGGKITKVNVASLDDGGNYRSQMIDQQAIPILEQQVMQAQSANIQGVSGASYTSQGFEQSLQSALSNLNFK